MLPVWVGSVPAFLQSTRDLRFRPLLQQHQISRSQQKLESCQSRMFNVGAKSIVFALAVGSGACRSFGLRWRSRRRLAGSGLKAVGKASTAKESIPDERLPVFPFPQADLPWQPEYIRVAGPSDMPQRKTQGDWLSLFRNAAPYIAAFRGGSVVVHLPSFLLEPVHREDFKGLMEDVAFCSLLGLRMVIVSSIESRVLRQISNNITSRVAPEPMQRGPQGRFVVDAALLAVAKQEAGFARVEVESALSAGFQKRSFTTPDHNSADGTGTEAVSAGIFPVRGAVSVISSMNLFSAAPIGVVDGVDYRYAGVCRSVNTELLERRLADGDIVSLTPLGASPSGEVFFVSSEHLAAEVARKLNALKLVYITRGQRLIDSRDQAVIAGMQVHNAQDLGRYLLGTGASAYPAAVRESQWFGDFLRQLDLLVSSVCSGGVQRGHLVAPMPGMLLQEFYTTDGSGTVVAQDVYQGLGCATPGDAEGILELLETDAAQHHLASNVRIDAEEVATGCARGEFFVWRRDEVVLGCGQLVWADWTGVAELKQFAIDGGFSGPHAPALLAYAARAAIAGGAYILVMADVGDVDPRRADWLTKRGFRPATRIGDGDAPRLEMPLGARVAEEAESRIAAFTEEQRMWGGI